MTTTEIKFDRTLTAIGRNGTSQAHGIEICNDGSQINLYPINSKGQVSNCLIPIPKEHLQEVIDHLTKCL
jgi:hypothetical protein